MACLAGICNERIMVELKVITKNEEFTGLERSWGALLERSSANSIFLSWDWLWNWWHIYAQDRDELRVLVWQQDGEVIGIAPFYIRKKRFAKVLPIRQLRFLGTQEEGEGDVGSDYMDLICIAGREDEFVSAVWSSIAAQNLCDEMRFDRMDMAARSVPLLQRAALEAACALYPCEEFRSPYIKLPSTWDEYLKSLSSSLRYKIRNERRQLQNAEQEPFRIASNEQEAKQALDDLIHLHQKRWTGRGHTGSFSNSQFERFHRQLAPALLGKGRLQLATLNEKDETRAVLYNFFFANKIFFYQSGIDTAPGAPAYGYLLHSYCIEQAIDTGMSEYDFLPKGGSDDYKDRFANDSRTVSGVHIVRSRLLRLAMMAREGARRLYYILKRIRHVFAEKPSAQIF